MEPKADMEAGIELEPEAVIEAGMEMKQAVVMDTEMEPERRWAFREAGRISGTDNLTVGSPSLLRYINLQFQ